jgi:hypothetical protein
LISWQKKQTGVNNNINNNQHQQPQDGNNSNQSGSNNNSNQSGSSNNSNQSGSSKNSNQSGSSNNNFNFKVKKNSNVLVARLGLKDPGFVAHGATFFSCVGLGALKGDVAAAVKVEPCAHPRHSSMLRHAPLHLNNVVQRPNFELL